MAHKNELGVFCLAGGAGLMLAWLMLRSQYGGVPSPDPLAMLALYLNQIGIALLVSRDRRATNSGQQPSSTSV